MRLTLENDEQLFSKKFIHKIVAASAVSFVCAVIDLCTVRLKLLGPLLMRMGEISRYGEEHVWDYTLNSGKSQCASFTAGPLIGNYPRRVH
jgi:hypothetical protein